MASNTGNGDADRVNRKPFKSDDKVQAWKLCAKSAIRIDELKADLKEEQERFEKLKEAIRAGGYLVEDQGHLPLPDGDDGHPRA